MKAEIENLKAEVTKTKEFGTGKGDNQSSDIPKWIKTPTKDGKLSKKSNEKLTIFVRVTESMIRAW